jgi:hypothetical protein
LLILTMYVKDVLTTSDQMHFKESAFRIRVVLMLF